ncbi:MAG: dihydropteroate synthase [Planctomycetes bacterium]|nr:dihydropteroate synthase [Planctomycetota bacterium]
MDAILETALARLNPLVLSAPGLNAPADAAPREDEPALATLVLSNLERPERDFLANVLPAAFAAGAAGGGRLTGDAAVLRARFRQWAEDAPPARALGGALCAALAAAATRRFHIPLAHDRALELAGEPVIMGVLNATPDSFSDGGRFADAIAAADHGLRMFEAGAGIVDVGGESTRPGSRGVSAEEELQRVLPVLERLRARSDGLLSADTSKAVVARAAVAAGAHLLNDVTALRGDPEMAAVAAQCGAGVVLMHMRGCPRTMQEDPRYGDVVADVVRELREALVRAREAGIPLGRTLVDPGIGFGKTLAHNLALLHGLDTLRSLGRPRVLGASRKSFLGSLTGVAIPHERTAGSVAVAALAAAAGVEVLRVHDVAETRQAVRVARAVARGRPPEEGTS